MTGNRRHAFRPAALAILVVAFLVAMGGSGMALVAPAETSRAPAASPEPTGIAAVAVLAPTPTVPLTVVPVPAQRPEGLTEAEVVDVVDGDTIKVRIGGDELTVRYIGIDTPEVSEGEPLADEATAVNRQLIDGQAVGLEKDVSETDQYGRQLRYVWAGDLMVNAELVRLGLAEASAYPPDTRYQQLFTDLQQQAQQEDIGLWQPGLQPSEPPGTEEPEPTVFAPPATAGPKATAVAPARNCDPAYPGVCIPPPPPDLDCDDIPYRNFRVLPPDPHHFDRDGDGIGCEQ